MTKSIEIYIPSSNVCLVAIHMPFLTDDSPKIDCRIFNNFTF